MAIAATNAPVSDSTFAFVHPAIAKKATALVRFGNAERLGKRGLMVERNAFDRRFDEPTIRAEMRSLAVRQAIQRVERVGDLPVRNDDRRRALGHELRGEIANVLGEHADRVARVLPRSARMSDLRDGLLSQRLDLFDRGQKGVYCFFR